MSNIIAGRFDQQASVQQAREALLLAGFSEDEVASFYVNPPGQHNRYPIGGDHFDSPGAEQSEAGLAVGGVAGGIAGAALGAAAMPVLGPVGPIAGALLGAHVGDLIGSLNKMEDSNPHADKQGPKVRHAGMLVAVATADPADETRAISVLRSMNAVEIERAHGTIADGDWKDFDPLTPPALVEERHQH